jgi:hypothetical protein
MMMEMYLTMNSNSQEEEHGIEKQIEEDFHTKYGIDEEIEEEANTSRILGQIGSVNDIQVDDKLLLNINTTKIEELGPKFSLVLYKNMFMIFSQCFLKTINDCIRTNVI